MQDRWSTNMGGLKNQSLQDRWSIKNLPKDHQAFPDIPTPRLGFQSRLSSNQNIQSMHSGNRPSSNRQNNFAVSNPGQNMQQMSNQPQKDIPPQQMLSNPPHNIAGDIPEIAWDELTVKESLGNGEFGQVFKGSWRGQEVAIKALYREPHKQGDAAAIAELKKEIESFRHLDHKRLVRFLGACFEHPHLCFITEYMPNGSLYNFLHVRKVRLPTRHALNMSMQLADGVDYLHSRTPIVVHRDLKSLNVVLDLKFNLKLCDFGLTESLSSSRARHNGGSPRYMAPELFDKKLKITEKIDVWAMACILCEVWGGTIPYDGVKDMPTLTAIMTKEKRSPTMPPNILAVPEMKELVKDCFNFDQEKRCGSREICKRLLKIKTNLSRAVSQSC